MTIKLRPAAECRWALVSLGEVMLRLDPGDGRVHTTRTFQAWEGGGEYNVARGLRRCFGLRTAVVTALADNPVGRLVEDLMLQGGVDQRVRWVKYDGVGRTARNGLNFTERGFGVRAALGCSDRGHTAVSQLAARRRRLGRDLRPARRALVPHRRHLLRALRNDAARRARRRWRRRAGTARSISYDLNYRDSLWKADRRPGDARREVNRELAPLRRRDDRQRGGLHRRARLRGGGRRRAPLGDSTRRTSRR